MKATVLFFILTLFLFACKQTETEKDLVLYQPNQIVFDTTKPFFTYIKKYIELINKRDNNNQFILVLYNNDERLHMKITAMSTRGGFNTNFPNYYIKYKGNLIAIFTGVDQIGVIDTSFVQYINSKFPDKIEIYNPGCWEIVYGWDTCYYFPSNYPLSPIINH
jgi:hypothetical protein